MSEQPVKPQVDPSIRNAARWIALILFILYAVDLIWKLAHWSQYSAGLKHSTIAWALVLRILFMIFLLVVFFNGRKKH